MDGNWHNTTLSAENCVQARGECNIVKVIIILIASFVCGQMNWLARVCTTRSLKQKHSFLRMNHLSARKYRPITSLRCKSLIGERVHVY